MTLSIEIFPPHIYIKKGKQLASLLNEDPAIMQPRTSLAKRLKLYRSAQSEIEGMHGCWQKIKVEFERSNWRRS